MKEKKKFPQWVTYYERLLHGSQSTPNFSASYHPQWTTYQEDSLMSRQHTFQQIIVPSESFISLLDFSPNTASWVGTPRPLGHISYRNWICRHGPHTSQASHNTEFVHISSGNCTCRHIIQNLCTYPKGIKYAGTIEEVKEEIETKVTLRQEPHQNR